MAAKKSLSPSAAQIFEAQLNEMNDVRRDPDGLETLIYCIKRGRSFRDFAVKFPVSPEELKLADVEIRYFGRTVPVAVWAVNGVLFRLEFAEAIEKFDVVSDYTVETSVAYL
ncbi:hypothetical protein [Variovorax paradoxus]|uniref:hypothetical protein n=1 Tax=Variovorax paradoxus TaxID=34073 RepID=UPI003D6466B1